VLENAGMFELAEGAFKEDPELADIQGYIDDSGEGRWTVEEAIEKRVPTPVLMISLFARFASRQEDSFSAKVIAALRIELKSFFGETEKNAVARAMPIAKNMEKGIVEAKDLF